MAPGKERIQRLIAKQFENQIAQTMTANVGFIGNLTGNVTGNITGEELNFSSSTPSTHPINLEGLTLPASSNVIRGASINPTRASGWISFSGTVSATPAQVYSDYRELHTTGVAEVLGFGSFPYMDSGASCATMLAHQAIAYVSTGATVATAAGAPGVGVFALLGKTVIDNATFHSSGVAAAAHLSFQANVTSVGALDTSILNMEVASGQIGSMFRVRMTAGAISRAFVWFDAATVAPIIQDPTLFHDPNAVTCEKGLHIRIGNVSYMIPLYVSDSGGIVPDW